MENRPTCCPPSPTCCPPSATTAYDRQTTIWSSEESEPAGKATAALTFFHTRSRFGSTLLMRFSMICDRGWRTRWPEAECVDDWSPGIPLSHTRELAAGQREARGRHRGQGRPGEHCTTTEYT